MFVFKIVPYYIYLFLNVLFCLIGFRGSRGGRGRGGFSKSPGAAKNKGSIQEYQGKKTTFGDDDDE